ncbi:Popeye conserved region protein [Nitzschia inconspicua]|uniref:Popeye conserved region protein n=1 Tax=Nitzschia inconspicua TaxID=303405 RepID=A0A9K3PAY4_9STRA|nr:Popeye conserved region protein [Nitzschia inconspicua]
MSTSLAIAARRTGGMTTSRTSPSNQYNIFFLPLSKRSFVSSKASSFQSGRYAIESQRRGKSSMIPPWTTRGKSLGMNSTGGPFRNNNIIINNNKRRKTTVSSAAIPIKNKTNSARRQRPLPSASSSRRKGTMAMRQQQSQQQQQQQQQGNASMHQDDTIPWLDRINLYLNQPRPLPIPRWISPQRVTFTYSEIFGHASFVLVAVSYAVDEFVQLRLLAIFGSTAMLVFTYFHPHGKVLWLPFRWNVLFIGLNSWRVAKVYLDRYRSDQLMNETLCRRIYEHHFYVMEKTDFARLVRLGTIENYKKGDVLIRQGNDNRYVRLVLKGDLQVDRDGQITYTLHEGQFISESGLHAGLGLRGSVESCCTVVAASDDVEVLRWDRTELMRLLEIHKSIERALKAVMSWDIVSKLKSQRDLLASGKIDNVERWTQKRREQTLSRYKAILHNMLAHPDYLNKRKEQLAKYRDIHHIQFSEHVLALKEMNWTLAEFEAGVKEGQVNEDKIERSQMGLRWWLRGWWNAL